MNIRPSLLFNQLALATIKSITNMTRVCLKNEVLYLNIFILFL
jgi:hypothetical protein